MSYQAVDYLLANPIALPVVPNVGEDRVHRVLVSLAWHAHQIGGLVYVSDRTQERETGLNRRAVIQPVRAVLEAEGWLVPTGRRRAKGTIEYALHIPGFTFDPSSGSGDLATNTSSGSGSGSGSGSAGLAQTEQNQTEPPLTPQRELTQNPPQGGKEQRDQVVAWCIQAERNAWTRLDPVGDPLVRKWAREYTQLAHQAMKENPGASVEALGRICVQQRNPHAAPKQPQPQPNRDCPRCSGQGWYLGSYDPDTNSSTKVDCDCHKGLRLAETG